MGLAIFAVRSCDGHILWRKDFPQNGGLASPLTFANGVVYFVASGNTAAPLIVPATFLPLNSKNGETSLSFF